MAFLAPDDRLLVMDINRSTYDRADPDYSLKTDEMKQLRDAGVRTVLQQMWWDGVERDGVRDWWAVDVGVERAREAGLQLLLQCYQRPPGDLPAAWYACLESGEPVGHLSIWNDEASDYEASFVREMAARYAGEDVLLINSLISDGETLLVLKPSWWDPAAVASHQAAFGSGRMQLSRPQQWAWLRESMIRKMVQYQGLLLEVQAHGEIWMSLHPFIKNSHTGNQFTHEILAALRATWPEVAIMWLLYTFYEFPAAWQGEQLALARSLDLGLVTGAGHCQGLARTVPLAKANGHRLLCGPRHDQILPDQVLLESWQIEKMGWAVQALG